VLAQAIDAGLRVGEGVHLAGVLAVDVADVAQPVVDETVAVRGERRAHAAAAEVAADDDVAHSAPPPRTPAPTGS